VVKGLDLKLGAQATVPLGRGLGNVGVLTSVEGSLGPASLEVGGRLDRAWSNAPELNFADPTGLRPGAFARLEVETPKLGGVFAQMDVGGLRNEPLLSVGIRIGGTSQARLNPFW
jgi:hypothetical protein